MHKKSLWAVIAIVWSAVCYGDIVREVWIIHSPKAKWEEILLNAGISETYVDALLQKHGITIQFGELKPADVPKVSSSSFPTLEPTLLWKDDYTSIYYPGVSRVAGHILVVLNAPKNGLSEVSSEDALKLRKTVNRVLQVQREKFHLTNTVIAQWNERQAGQPSRFTVEVIPCRADSNDVHNALDKMLSNNYVLFRGMYPYLSETETSQKREEEIAKWKLALQDAESKIVEIPSIDPVMDWTQVQTHRWDAGYDLFNNFYETLLRQGLNVERTVTSETLDEPDILITPKRGCAFCIPKVIDYQKVFESELCYVFYNFKPAVPGAHFLISPKRHLQFSHNLLAEEIRDMHELAQKLTKALEIKYGRKDVKMYIQDGPSVGQTVPHSHMHLMLTPDPVKYMLFSLNYDQEIPIPAEEMKRVTTEMKALLETL